MTQGRVFLISLPTVESRLTSQTSPRLTILKIDLPRWGTPARPEHHLQFRRAVWLLRPSQREQARLVCAKQSRRVLWSVLVLLGEHVVLPMKNLVIHGQREFLRETERDQRVVQLRVGREPKIECDRHAL